MSSWASVLESVRSLTATHSMSAFAGLGGAKDVAADAAEAVDPDAYWHGLDPTVRTAAAHTTSTRKPSGSPQIGGVVAAARTAGAGRARPRRCRRSPSPAANAASTAASAGGRDRDVAERRRRSARPRATSHSCGAVDAVGDRARAFEHPPPADRVHQRVVELRRPLQVGHLEARRGRTSGVAFALSTSRCSTSTNRSSRSRVALREVLGDRDAAVAPAGAADRDHQVRLALGHVLRQQEVQQRLEVLVELVEAAVAVDVRRRRGCRGPVSGRSSGS